MYLVIDTVSRNVMGECESLAEAKALFLDLVAYHPPGATEIEILSESGVKQPVSQDEVMAALEAAATG
jgi:hypothetical protein